MAQYNHTRPTRSWGGNISTADPDVSEKTLSIKIEEALPGKAFKLCLEGTNLCAIFDQELSAGEQTTLSDTIAAFTAVQPE